MVQAPSRRWSVYPRRPSPTLSKSSHTTARSALRTQIVWGAFGVAMTLAAGFLVLTNGGLRPVPPAVTLNADQGSSTGSVQPDRERWKAIVIHHSGSPGGSPESIDRLHRAAGLTGMGYHFVIGNGIDYGDGAIFASPRWTRQEPGAHVADRGKRSGPDAQWFNEHSIGICLVGNGERRPFTDAQLRRLGELVAELQRELGIPDQQVYLHSDLASVTNPGRFFPLAAFESALRR